LFAAGDVGNSIFLTAADGTEHEFKLEGYTNPVLMTGHITGLLPADLRATPTLLWAKALKTMTGLAHLEGKAVSVYADGFVAASPNNSDYPVLTVAGGQITLDRPYGLFASGCPLFRTSSRSISIYRVVRRSRTGSSCQQTGDLHRRITRDLGRNA
jgi:hypothetical protein